MHHMVVRPPAEDERTPLFSLRQLAYTYPDATPGLREINVDIFAGDRIGLVGQNGSGNPLSFATSMACCWRKRANAAIRIDRSPRP